MRNVTLSANFESTRTNTTKKSKFAERIVVPYFASKPRLKCSPVMDNIAYSNDALLNEVKTCQPPSLTEFQIKSMLPSSLGSKALPKKEMCSIQIEPVLSPKTSLH